MVEGEVRRGARTVIALNAPTDLVQLAYGMLGSPDEVRAELDRINADMARFFAMEPDLALRAIAAYTPRVTEICRHLFRVEIRDHTWVKIRTMDAVPLLDELERQLKIHSRLLEQRAQDLAAEGIRR